VQEGCVIRKIFYLLVIAGCPTSPFRLKTDLPRQHCSDNVARETPSAWADSARTSNG
jgi:hypothetical protein